VSSGRRSARRQAVFILYQQDLLRLSAEAALERAGEEQVDGYARAVVQGVAADSDSIETLLSSHLAGWSLDRLGVLERAILRVAAFELLRRPDVPEAVVIDQAVELAKRFCSAEAGALVNGILGSMARVRGENGGRSGEAEQGT
jgi:transcription antitermination protein NusB